MLKALFSLPRSVWLLGLISLVNDSASEMMYPLIPLYLSGVLMAGPRVLGLIEGMAEAVASLLKLWAGVMVDRSGTAKPWIIGGYGIAGLARPAIAFVGSWPLLLVLRVADRIGKAVRAAPRDALLAANIAPGQRGLAFGLHRAMDNSGAVIGPLLAWALLSAGAPLQQVFLWALLPGLACLALTTAVRDAPPPAAPPPAFSWVLADLPLPLRRYLVVVALFTLGNSSNMFLFLRARELGVSESQVPLLWAAVSAVAALFSVPLSGLSDRFGRVRLLVTGYLAYAVFYVGMAVWAEPGWRLYALFGLYGIFMAATEGVERALMADLAPPEQRGTAFGWLNLVMGALLLPASLLFGWLWEGLSATVAFGFSASCALAAALLLTAWVRPGTRMH
ncbi:MFS transporter [Pelomonas aquatica]|jgi:MFS family permease|uniref:MFS transporter n=1 Tax=Pelomonas aquatica TaxID=431058 RepID=A0A9X4R5F1_9BURK|nr:MFS transporter [Pelomonas aquatica]MCY4756548.1 MFS transporter [Pelomonas aquatica]MDG0863576.1 MFS transporter [Pelomonas aquatica]